MTTTNPRPLAAVTGASTGIGFELARCCADFGYDLLITADEPRIYEAAHELRGMDVRVGVLQTDLATRAGVDRFYAAAQGRPIEALIANAGRGLGGAFLDQQYDDVRRVIETNVTGTVYLLHKAAFDMRVRGRGKILLTGSIAGFFPGAFQAVYNGTKAFTDSFAAALGEELRKTGVTVTCLMPGPTDTEFFERAGLSETPLGEKPKADAAAVARAAFEAMQRGDTRVITGFKNTLQVAAAGLTPAAVLAKQHRKIAEPGSSTDRH
jgi:short-subunit dehydrogenase